MSKSMIQAFALAQIASITEKTVKDRLRFTIAGCKDGHLYSHEGTDFGLFDADAPDTEFITDADMELSRASSAKVAKIQNSMKEFFNVYGVPTDNVVKSDDTNTASDNDAEEVAEEVAEDAPEVAESIEVDIAKAIKKGKFKKAQKLIDSIGGHKKLQKKLNKASK